MSVRLPPIGGTYELELLVRNHTGGEHTLMSTRCIPAAPLTVEKRGEDG